MRDCGAPLGVQQQFEGHQGVVKWQGLASVDAEAFCRYLRDTVSTRIRDDDSGFGAEIRALATTGMNETFIEGFLAATPDPLPWEIGEALAECMVVSDSEMDVIWPWNTARDRRTPRASLPGADLVGFLLGDGETRLLFGEVKTSSDVASPPNVMHGGKGMIWQLEESAHGLGIQHALLRWLLARCQTDADLHRHYRAAVGRYLVSEGQDFRLLGVLVRDTPATEQDLASRGRALAALLVEPLAADLVAVYLPVPIGTWPTVLAGGDDG